MSNTKLRIEIYKSKVKQYEIAERLEISPYKMCRLLQTDLSEEQKKKILDTLRELEQEKAQEPVTF